LQVNKAMKTQAMGWLAAGVVALGLNGFYHDGGFGWAHRVADQVVHNSAAVLALATGRADRFLAEARLVNALPVNARPQTAPCHLATAMAAFETRVARSESGLARLETMSGQQEAALARVEANRARMEAQRARIEARIAARVVPANIVPVSMKVPVACPRVLVNVPRVPMIRMPMIRMPVIHFASDAGPV
jgi:hypothetical protein